MRMRREAPHSSWTGRSDLIAVTVHSARLSGMFARFSVVLVLLGWRAAIGLLLCPPLVRPLHGSVRCSRAKARLSCGSRLPVGSVAKFTCREFYKMSPEDESLLRCRSDGSWSSSAPKCIPDCGRRLGSVSLIVRGSAALPGAFPWHVAIYYLTDGSYEYGCGGSLISETSVLTAAHCVWETPPEILMVAFGKFHRGFDRTDEDEQRRKVRRIETLSSYQDVAGNYNGDIAVMFLRERVRIGPHAAPVCVDWEQRLTEVQLVEGASGVVPGWGLTENDTLGDSLRVVRLPVVSDEKCISEQERDFKKFVTYTAFCAGHANGTGVCNGDSGGGLAFFDAASGRWYLQGLVSVSPRRKGTPYCDLNFYTVFTKVAAFSRWLKAVGQMEGETWGSSAGKLLTEEDRHVTGSEIVYPHSKIMLELAGLLNATQKPSQVRRP